MTTTTDTAALRAALDAAAARRRARDEEFIANLVPNETPARRLPPRERNHSVRHRAYR